MLESIFRRNLYVRKYIVCQTGESKFEKKLKELSEISDIKYIETNVFDIVRKGEPEMTHKELVVLTTSKESTKFVKALYEYCNK